MRRRWVAVIFVLSAQFMLLAAVTFGGHSLAFCSEGGLSEDRGKLIEQYLKDAQGYFEDGKYHHAIKLWTSVLAISPDNEIALKGVEKAEAKIAKIKTFFGRDVFKGMQKISKLSLDECIEIAKEASLLFNIAKEQVDLSRSKVFEAKRSFFPSLTLSWAESKGIREAGKTHSVEYGLEARQPALRSGELVYTLAQSRVNLNIAEMNYDTIEMDIYYEVAEAYYKFVQAKKMLLYIKEFYRDITPFYTMAKNKHERGLIADIEYLDTESKYNQMHFKNISVESDYEIAKLALEQKLNIERAGTVDVEEDFALKTIDKDLDTCLFLAVDNRPDLKIEELSVKSAEYGKRITLAKDLPKVDLTGEYKEASEVYRENFQRSTREGVDPHRKWYAGVEVTWPLMGSTGTYSSYKRKDPATLSTFHGSDESQGNTFKLGVLDNLKQLTDAEEADVALARAKQNLEDKRKKVIKEVKDAFYNYEKAKIQMEAAVVQKTFSEKESNILKVKHSLGDSRISELMDSLVRLMDANETYLKAERDLSTAIAALNKAIGLKDYF
ncbi:MAG: TolC family protein [Candidatus Omnitrophica bacterium]|nr:TolC family protein [Candidatus Omnitrophota bacterium]